MSSVYKALAQDQDAVFVTVGEMRPDHDPWGGCKSDVSAVGSKKKALEKLLLLSELYFIV